RGCFVPTKRAPGSYSLPVVGSAICILPHTFKVPVVIHNAGATAQRPDRRRQSGEGAVPSMGAGGDGRRWPRTVPITAELAPRQGEGCVDAGRRRHHGRSAARAQLTTEWRARRRLLKGRRAADAGRRRHPGLQPGPGSGPSVKIGLAKARCSKAYPRSEEEVGSSSCGGASIAVQQI
ncbi:unnamed protein product, partial [Urochloa humidicola]